MKNRLLFSLLAALGFTGCSEYEERVYYGPGPNWNRDIQLITRTINENNEPINGIRVVASYRNQKDSLITDTAYTHFYGDSNKEKIAGVAENTLKFKDYPSKNKREIVLEYTDVDGEANGTYETKILTVEELPENYAVTLLKKKDTE